MCGIGVTLGSQLLGGYTSARSSQKAASQQYANMAQQYANMANSTANMATTNRNNANIIRFNEIETGRQGAQEQAQIRRAGRQAQAQINVNSAANGVQGVSIDQVAAESAGNTTRDVNTSKYNTNLQLYGMENQAQNYLDTARAYDQMSEYYNQVSSALNDYASSINSRSLAWTSGIGNALGTWLNYSRLTSGTGGTNTNVSTFADSYYSGRNVNSANYLVDYFTGGGSWGNTNWNNPTGNSSLLTSNSKSSKLGLTIPY